MSTEPKMNIYSVIIFNTKVTPNHPTVLGSAYDVSSVSWFQQSTAKEVLLFASRECAARTNPGQRQSIENQEHLCHIYVTLQGLAVAVVASENYPQRAAFGLASAVINEFNQNFASTPATAHWETTKTDISLGNLDAVLAVMLKKYQDPLEADKLLKIQKDIDSTRDVLIQTMEKLLDRGDALSDLAAKSDDLSLHSKIFLDRSTALNSCCVIL